MFNTERFIMENYSAKKSDEDFIKKVKKLEELAGTGDIYGMTDILIDMHVSYTASIALDVELGTPDNSLSILNILSYSGIPATVRLLGMDFDKSLLSYSLDERDYRDCIIGVTND